MKVQDLQVTKRKFEVLELHAKDDGMSAVRGQLLMLAVRFVSETQVALVSITSEYDAEYGIETVTVIYKDGHDVLAEKYVKGRVDQWLNQHYYTPLMNGSLEDVQ